MKLFFAFFLLVNAAILFAEVEQTEGASATYSTTLADKTFYIRDYMYVPLRSGESSAYRVIHKGLKSGTAITIIKQNPESGYSLIRTKDGTEGWLPTQYLMSDLTAAQQLKIAEKQIKTLRADLGPAGERLLVLEKQNGVLETQLSETRQQLDTLQSAHAALQNLSTNAIKMDQDYRQQLVTLQNNQIAIDALTIENDQLKKELSNNELILGAFILFSGMMLAYFIQWVLNRRRKRSEW